MRRCAHECFCWAMVEYGDDECPGRCDAYAPMVDVDALLALADEIRSTSCDNGGELTVDLIDVWGWAQAIREALGANYG